MPRKRKLITISFKTAQDLDEAKDKCEERNEGFSEHIQTHFKNLPHKKK